MVVTFLQWVLGLCLLLAAAFMGAVYLLFGGGSSAPDLTGEPLLDDTALEVVAVSDMPIADVAISEGGRVFYSLHPEADPQGPSVLEWADGQVTPFPPAPRQAQLLETPQGLTIGPDGLLWVLDSGNQGFGTPRLLAFDIATGELRHQHDFDPKTAPRGSYLQDLVVGPEGRWVYIADTGVVPQRPALIVYDSSTSLARRVLNRHETVFPQSLTITAEGESLSYFGGIAGLRAGVSGIALSDDGAWLYYGALNHGTLYRVPTALLQDARLPHNRLAVDIETVGRKPLSDGIAVDGNTAYVSDVERGAILRYAPEQSVATVFRDELIRWPDAMTLGPDGALYVADSALGSFLLRSAGEIEDNAPYRIWRIGPLPPVPEPE